MKSFILFPFYLIGISITINAQPGTLDQSFGNNGTVITDGFATCYSAALQSGQRIVLGGSGGAGFLLARYLRDGQLDSSFGINGKVDADLGMYDEISSIAIQNDDKIVAAGYEYTDFFYDEFGDAHYNMNFALARFLPNGIIDSSFGTNGKVITDFGQYEWGYSVLIQPDGKIVMGGTIAPPPPYEPIENFLVVRYLPDGNIDQSFGDQGKVITDVYSKDILRTLELQKDGKIVAAGSTNKVGTSNSGKFALTRYLPDGSLDVSFGNGGIVIDDFGKNDEEIRDLAIQPDDKIVATGFANANLGFFNMTMALSIFNADGSLDTLFGTSGKVTIKFTEGISRAESVTLQPNGKIVVAGEVFISDYQNFALTRVDANGNTDAAFGTNGKVTTDFGGDDYSRSCLLQNDGKIVLAGNSFDLNTQINHFALARYIGEPTQSHLITKINSYLRNNVLAWYSTNNRNVNYYSVQRSTNGSSFTEEKRVQPQSIRAISEEKALSYALAQAKAGSYYRVAAIMNDGSIIYSDVIAYNSSHSAFTIYPNPVKDVLHVSGLTAAGKTALLIINAQGNIIKKTTVQNNSYDFNVSQLKQGTYYLRVETSKGNNSFQFIKE